MSLNIIFPNENKMKVEDLAKLKDKLSKLLQLKEIGKKEIDKLKKTLAKFRGYLLVADRNNLKEYFEKFCNLNTLDSFDSFLKKNNEEIKFSIFEMISFLVININNQELLKYIYSKKYPNMNIIDKIISINTKNNEEFLSQQINFIKSLALKINIDTLQYFYDSNYNQFPILTKSLSLYNYGDSMVRNVVKNIFLTLLGIENNKLREFLISFPINLYYPNIIFLLKNTILELSSIDIGVDEERKIVGRFQKETDFIVEVLMYLDDLLSLNIHKINYIIINCLLNEIIVPIINELKKKEKIQINVSLYILCLILFINKNKFLNNILSIFLFNQKIPDSLYKKVCSSSFSIIKEDIMKTINFLIIHNLYADVNDARWQKIKEFMKITTGNDLSIGEIDINNIYDFSKNIINMKDDNGNIDNPIFANVKDYLMSSDDNMILILNIIINSCIKFNKKLLMDKKDNINEINEDVSYNLLNKDYFQIDLNNNNSDNLLNALFKFFSEKKSFRLATYEIILTNIQLLIKTFLEKNDNNIDYKKKLTSRLIKLINVQFNELDELLKSDILNQYIFDSCIKVYDHYNKNANKKINDLVTLPYIIIPMKYLDKIKKIPEHLRYCKNNQELLRNYIFNIFFINDIINDLYDNKDEIIKSKRFPLQIETIQFSIGKEYSKNDIGGDYVECKMKKNNDYVLCEAISSYDTLYLGEIMNFKDFSKIKIIKKIPLRYLEIKNGENIFSLNLIDKTNEITQQNSLSLYFNDENEKINTINIFMQQIKFCLDLEESLFNSFIEEMKKKLNTLI